MIVDDLFLEFTSLEQSIYKARQAVLLELILHLYELENSLTYSYWMANFQFLFIFIIYFTCFTISSYLSVCQAIFAKFINYCISLIINYSLKMQCQCHKRAFYLQKIQQQQETILLLHQFIDKEKQVHLQEIRAINQSLEEFAKEKDTQIRQFQQSILKLGKKLDQYKQKNNSLNQKLKETTNTVKVLMQKKIHLQSQIIRLKGQIDKEHGKRLQQARILSEMRQIVNLQEIQNKQLTKQNDRLRNQIVYLQSQITNFNSVKDKFGNIQHISEQQYQKEISLLKTELQQQFGKNTNDIFNCMTRKCILEDKNMSKQTEFNINVIIENEQLNKLANYIDYGTAYFQLENNDLTLEAGKKIFKEIARLAKELKKTHLMLNQQKQISFNLAKELRDKLSQFQEQITFFRQKQVSNKQTQTNQASKIEQIVNSNHSLKIKVYSLTKIITFLSQFSIYLFRAISLSATKKPYFHFTQACLYSLKPKRPKLKSVCFSIFFTIVLKKKVSKLKRIAIDERFDRLNLSKYLTNQNLVNLLYSFTIKERRKIGIKNYKIEELTTERSQINPSQKIIQILNQQSLNQGSIQINYSELLNRFIFQKQRRMRVNE